MTVKEVLDYFGGMRATAEAVGVRFQSVHQWKTDDKVPEGRQWQIQALSASQLTVDPELLKKQA